MEKKNMAKDYIEHTDVEWVKENIKTIAEENGYDLTKNVEAIAKAKLRFFGVENWRKCPCVRDDEHACISAQCKLDIENDGVCHCNLYKKKEQ